MPLQGEIPPNALRRKQDPLWWGGFSLGVDLGLSRTGLAISKGFCVRPLTVKPLSAHFNFTLFSLCLIWIFYFLNHMIEFLCLFVDLGVEFERAEA